MIRIGEFARLASASVKTVRYYSAVGLLPPAAIDRRTGYRLYRPSQATELRRIRRLREVGFGLDEIEAILRDPASLHDRLQAQRARLLSEACRVERQVARLDRLLESGTVDGAPLVVRWLGSAFVAGLRARLSSYDEMDRLFLEAERLVPPGAAIRGRIAAWWTGTPEKGVDAEALFLVDQSCPGARRLDRGLVVSTCYSGEAWEEPYAELVGWMAANGRSLAGPKLEQYLDGDQVELQFPLRPADDPASTAS